MRRVLCVVLLLLLVLGCKATQHVPMAPRAAGVARVAGRGCTSEIKYNLAPDWSPAEVADLLAAMELWRTGTWGAACWVPSKAPGSLRVLRAANRQVLAVHTKAWPKVIGLYVASLPAVYVVAGAPLFSVAVHEFGHAMGIPHETDWQAPSFMHAEDNNDTPESRTELPYVDLRAFCLLHGC